MRRRAFKAQAGATARRSRAALALGAAALLILPLAGCGLPIITFQAEPAADAGPPVADPANTGSIETRPATFGSDLGPEDWRRAHSALSVALDPQGNGRPVKWDNPDSAMRGSVNPTGLPYVANDMICRDFLASIIAPGKSRFVRGAGCKPSGGEWELRRVRSAKAAP